MKRGMASVEVFREVKVPRSNIDAQAVPYRVINTEQSGASEARSIIDTPYAQVWTPHPPHKTRF
jgi:hypothetical protein